MADDKGLTITCYSFLCHAPIFQWVFLTLSLSTEPPPPIRWRYARLFKTSSFKVARKLIFQAPIVFPNPALTNFSFWDGSQPSQILPGNGHLFYNSSSPRLETQSPWFKFQPECRRPVSHLKTEKANSPLPCFCSLQASKRLDDAHPHWGRQSTLLTHWFKC